MPKKREISEMRKKLAEEAVKTPGTEIDEIVTRIDVPEKLFNEVFERPKKKRIFTETFVSLLITTGILFVLMFLTVLYWNFDSLKLDAIAVSMNKQFQKLHAEVQLGRKAADSRLDKLERRVRALEHHVFERPEPKN